jgi:hypothetical protein
MQQVGVKFYVCSTVAWKMYNIKFTLTITYTRVLIGIEVVPNDPP